MNEQLPTFDESSQDIPAGWGIEHNHDGNWYAYRIPAAGHMQVYLKDERGFDADFPDRGAALAAILRER